MIILKTAGEIETMAEASRVVAETLEVLKQEVRPGITTEHLDRIAEENIRVRGRALRSRDIATIQGRCARP